MTEPLERPLLNVQNIKLHFPIVKGPFRNVKGYVKAVDGVSFDLKIGTTLAVVGESGCGKSTLGRCLLRVYKLTSGKLIYHAHSGPNDIGDMPESQLRSYRRDVRLVFQDPQSSLNPRMCVKDIVGDVFRIHKLADGSELEDRVVALLDAVGLGPEMLQRYPHALSGGQRQRVAIARALATKPRMLVCDEAVSALDVSVQAQILNLLKDLQSARGLSYIFISHDLSVVKYLAKRVAVMYVGRLVETAETDRIFISPKHPYTEALLAAVPKAKPTVPKRQERFLLKGEVADTVQPLSGCVFHPRCAYAENRCRLEYPALREMAPDHWVACHRAGELELRGVKPSLA